MTQVTVNKSGFIVDQDERVFFVGTDFLQPGKYTILSEEEVARLKRLISDYAHNFISAPMSFIMDNISAAQHIKCERIKHEMDKLLGVTP